MKPAKHDIEIRRGDFFRLFFRLREKLPNGDPGDYPDLTSWGTGLAQVRASVDGSVIFTMTATKANQATFPGGMLLTIDDALTKSAFPVSTTPGKWDFEIPNQLGETDTYLEGDVTFTKDVSFV